MNFIRGILISFLKNLPVQYIEKGGKMQRESFLNKLGHFLFLFFLLNFIGFIASCYMTDETLLWYRGLSRSTLTPPDFYFGAVWGILFILISLSGTLVWGKAPFLWFKIQTLLIFLWSFCFFFLHMPLLAFYVLILLIFSEVKNIKIFFPKSKVSGILLLPLLLWSLFALYLNFVIVL